MARQRQRAPAAPTPKVQAVFDSYPPNVRRKLYTIRNLIYRIAAATEGVGDIEETLKWNEPAYITSTSRSGSTIRLGWKRSTPDQCAIYFNCNSTLVEDFRTLIPNGLRFVSNRGVVFDVDDKVPADHLSTCIAMALTYHRNRRDSSKTAGTLARQFKRRS
jgi:hypothetical protein